MLKALEKEWTIEQTKIKRNSFGPNFPKILEGNLATSFRSKNKWKLLVGLYRRANKDIDFKIKVATVSKSNNSTEGVVKHGTVRTRLYLRLSY